MHKGPAVWNKRFVLINVIFFLVFSNISFFYLYPIALREMGSPDYLIGLIVGFFSAVTVVSRPFMGKAVARKGESPVIILGIVGILLASVTYMLEKEPGIFIFLTRALHGLGFSAFIAGSFSLVARTFPAAKRAQAYGVVGASLMSASAFCPPLGEVVVDRFGFDSLYLCAALAAMGALLLMVVASKNISLPSSRSHRDSITYIRLLNNRSFLYVLISTLVFAHCQSTVMNFVALFASSIGKSSGVFFAVAFSISILLLLALSSKIDRFGKKRFLRLCYPFLVAGLFLIPKGFDSNIIFVPAALFGIAMGLLFPAHNALAADHGSQAEKPGVMSLFTATYDTGFISGAVVSGWIAQVAELEYLFPITSILALVGFFIVLAGPIKESEIQVHGIK
ncbi:MAG: hypothetical protein DRH12_03105 [Deltaproteobacteria bacterium]|nr:MAG: hypothetical protein DRH12_03105 [Deltaproteobacteria bacterium]RLB86638.1 MAG: hypothetical protein DRH15_01065 [Deltaproteobacteria bacterium]